MLFSVKLSINLLNLLGVIHLDVRKILLKINISYPWYANLRM